MRSFFVYGFPDGLRRIRRIDVADAKMPQRVDDRVADCRRRSDGARLAATFHTERIARCWRADEIGPERRHIRCTRYSVVHEGPGEQLTRVVVIGHLFHHRLAY